MPKHIVFLVHGMGEHEKGWSDGVWAQLRTQYEALERDQLWPWDESFTRKEVVYDDAFETIRDNWRSDSTTVLSTLAAAGVSKSTQDKLTELAEESGPAQFLQTHILDVLHYRFVDTVHEAVKVRVGKQITKALVAAPSGTRWSLIAHSLGTSVSHDTLHALSAPDGAGVPGIKPAHLLVMLANVSRVLQTEAKAFESRVRPAGPGGAGVTNHFLNVQHRLDPIPACWPFHPSTEWPTPDIRATGRFEHQDLSVVTDPNVHGLDHYLRDPACYVQIFRKLTIPELISSDEERTLTADFLTQQLATAALRKARKKLEAMQPAPATSWPEFVEVLSAYFA